MSTTKIQMGGGYNIQNAECCVCRASLFIVVFSETFLVFSHININPTTRVAVGGLDPQGCQFILGGGGGGGDSSDLWHQLSGSTEQLLPLFFPPEKRRTAWTCRVSRYLAAAYVILMSGQQPWHFTQKNPRRQRREWRGAADQNYKEKRPRLCVTRSCSCADR